MLADILYWKTLKPWKVFFCNCPGFVLADASKIHNIHIIYIYNERVNTHTDTNTEIAAQRKFSLRSHSTLNKLAVKCRWLCAQPLHPNIY